MNHLEQLEIHLKELETPINLFGAALAHVIADLIASYLDPHLRSMALGIVIGGLI